MKKTQSGFTLIELLTVISIIALLSSTIFASLSSARDKAYVATVRLGMRQYVDALNMYQLDHNENGLLFPPDNIYVCFGHGPCINSGIPYPESTALMNDLDSYIKGTPSVVTRPVTVWGAQWKGITAECQYWDSTETICKYMNLQWGIPNPSGYSGFGLIDECQLKNLSTPSPYNYSVCDAGGCYCHVDGVVNTCSVPLSTRLGIYNQICD